MHADVIELTDLCAAVLSPTHAFVRQRLEVEVPREADEVSDAMPVDLVGLESWQVGERLLRELVRGRSPQQALETEWRQGAVPPGRYGWRQVQDTATCAHTLWQEYAASHGGVEPGSIDVDVALPDGRRVVGTVPGVFGERLVRVGYSRLAAKQRLRLWVDLVAVAAGDPGRSWAGRSIGRAEEPGAPPARATYRRPDDPLAVLTDLVALRDLALTRVVPLKPEAGRAWASQTLRGKPEWLIARDAGDAWRKESGGEHELCWGRRASWEDVVALTRDDGKPLFATSAEGLWTPALRAEAE
jgi:exodeoxyribonuclease V gamma subunit